jgi:ketosteroid isomerase-like protein
MRKHLIRGFWLSVFFAAVAVVAGSMAPALAQDKNAKALIAVDAAWSNAAVARNIEAVASYYAEDGVAYPPNAPPAIGRAAAGKVWATYLADPSFQISWKANSAGVENKTGWTAGTYQASFKGADGKTVTENGKYVTVWRKGGNGKWQAIHDMWNSNTK